MDTNGAPSLSPHKEEKSARRQTAEFHPSVWGDYFIAHCCSPPLTIEMKRRVKELKKEVKATLRDERDLNSILRLIDELQRLGLEYHFEEEIKESLSRIHDNDCGSDEDDLCTTALRFRLLRQQGYDVSSDVFKKFKDHEGKFKQELSNNIMGLLHMYEASFLAKPNEENLDGAREFAKGHIECHVKHNDDTVTARIQRALDIPFHQGMRRLEARHYITTYEEDEANTSHALLELAKLEFNHLQSLHQAEIKAISIWWRELGFVEELSFARDRVVECYFWSLGVQFEPQYSKGRSLLSRVIVLASVMDDMFDAFGTLEELQLFTNLIERWNFHDLDQLPKYMRVYLNSFMSIIKEIDNELMCKGRLHYKHYLIESIKALVAAYFKEAKWASKGYKPTLEEYLQVSVTSSGYPMLICVSLVIMGKEEPEDILRLVLTEPKAVKASALIARLMDDLVSTKLEQERNHVTSSMQCYMNDYAVTERKAFEELTKRIADAWKDMNEEWLKGCPSHKNLNMLALNFARMIKVIYRHEDGYTNPSGEMKDNISMLLIHPV